MISVPMPSASASFQRCWMKNWPIAELSHASL
jgi:hypothetical protein